MRRKSPCAVGPDDVERILNGARVSGTMVTKAEGSGHARGVEWVAEKGETTTFFLQGCVRRGKLWFEIEFVKDGSAVWQDLESECGGRSYCDSIVGFCWL